MKNFDSVFIHANIASFNPQFGFGADTPYGAINDGAVAVVNGKIAFVGTINEIWAIIPQATSQIAKTNGSPLLWWIVIRIWCMAATAAMSLKCG